MGRTSKMRVIVFNAVVIIIILCGCVENIVLPEDLNTREFSAGDTTYLQINPVWDASYGLVKPVEISVAPDGRLFIADSAAASIVVMEQSGSRLTEGFDALTDLTDSSGTPLTPIDVDIDLKLNILFIDGSDDIYCWNQYWNEVGIDSVVVAAEFRNTISNQITLVESNSYFWLEYLYNEEYEIARYIWSHEPSIIDSLLQPHIFFDGKSLYNEILDDKLQEASLTALSTVQDGSGYLMAADSVADRIMRIYYARNVYLALGSDEKVWAHIGIFGGNITTKGTGAGYVNNPTGLDIDYNNNVCYSQIGDFFSVHKISVQSGAYQSEFQPFTDDIMDIDRYSIPADVAVDADQMIYVSNTGGREIQVFNSDGSFFRKAGIEEYQVEIDVYDPAIHTGTVVDSSEYFYSIEQNELLAAPAGITVDDRGVIYVCDPSEAKILRFRLSNELDEDLQTP